MKNIAIFIYDYSTLGGAQKVTYNLCDLMLKNGFPIKCVISQISSEEMNYGYECDVELIGNDKRSPERLNSVLKKYDIGNLIVQTENLKRVAFVVGKSNYNCNLFFVLHSSPYNWVRKYYSLSQYVTSFHHVMEYIKMKFYWKPLNLKIFSHIVKEHGIVCVSQQAKKELCDLLNLSYNTSMVNYIYNPVPMNYEEKNVAKDNSVVYAGRLSQEKRPILMLKVWEEIHKSYPDWSFFILGEGPERKTMERYIKRHHLSNVFMVGSVNNVYYYMQKSKIALLFSKYEGLPTSILEAGMCKNALVVTVSDGGARDIVEDGENGYVVKNDIHDILVRLSSLMLNDGRLAVEMGDRNTVILDKFSNTRIIKKWESVLSES